MGSICPERMEKGKKGSITIDNQAVQEQQQIVRAKRRYLSKYFEWVGSGPFGDGSEGGALGCVWCFSPVLMATNQTHQKLRCYVFFVSFAFEQLFTRRRSPEKGWFLKSRICDMHSVPENHVVQPTTLISVMSLKTFPFIRSCASAGAASPPLGEVERMQSPQQDVARWNIIPKLREILLHVFGDHVQKRFVFVPF